MGKGIQTKTRGENNSHCGNHDNLKNIPILVDNLSVVCYAICVDSLSANFVIKIPMEAVDRFKKVYSASTDALTRGMIVEVLKMLKNEVQK